MDKNIGVGDFLNETMTIVSGASRDVAVYVLVIGGLAAIGIISGLAPVETGQIGFDYGVIIDQDSTLATALFDILSAVVSIVASYMLVRRYLLSRGRLWAKENRFWPYFGMVFVAGIGLIFGFILLIIPGLILLVRWSASSGFVVGAGRGVTEALSDSWHATKGHGWSIFFAGLAMLIGLAVVLGICGAILDLLGAIALGAFLDALGNAVAIAFGIGVYCLVSNNAEEVAEVFS